MISYWIVLIATIIISLFSFYLFNYFKEGSYFARLYNLQIQSCRELFNYVKLVCAQSPGTNISFVFIATPALKKVEVRDDEIICILNDRNISNRFMCKVDKKGIDLKYYKEGFISKMFEGEKIQKFLVLVNKKDWENVILESNITFLPNLQP